MERHLRAKATWKGRYPTVHVCGFSVPTVHKYKQWFLQDLLRLFGHFIMNIHFLKNKTIRYFHSEKKKKAFFLKNWPRLPRSDILASWPLVTMRLSCLIFPVDIGVKTLQGGYFWIHGNLLINLFSRKFSTLVQTQWIPRACYWKFGGSIAVTQIRVWFLGSRLPGCEQYLGCGPQFPWMTKRPSQFPQGGCENFTCDRPRSFVCAHAADKRNDRSASASYVFSVLLILFFFPF